MNRVPIIFKKLPSDVPIEERRDRKAKLVRADKEALREQRKCTSEPRSIDFERITTHAMELPIYPVGQRTNQFLARVIRHDDMAEVIGVQAKIFNGWLHDGKIPLAAYCINTGQRGFPPKAYLVEEARAIMECLRIHYVESRYFRATNVSLINQIKTRLTNARERKAQELLSHA